MGIIYVRRSEATFSLFMFTHDANFGGGSRIFLRGERKESKQDFLPPLIESRIASSRECIVGDHRPSATMFNFLGNNDDKDKTSGDTAASTVPPTTDDNNEDKKEEEQQQGAGELTKEKKVVKKKKEPLHVKALLLRAVVVVVLLFEGAFLIVLSVQHRLGGLILTLLGIVYVVTILYLLTRWSGPLYTLPQMKVSAKDPPKMVDEDEEIGHEEFLMHMSSPPVSTEAP